MPEYTATVIWTRSGSDFSMGRYSREHAWSFDGGLTIAASASPLNVPVPYSNPAHIDPEEAFVAAASSCHMLTYLFLAYKAGFQVDSYEDKAIGTMTKDGDAAPWISAISLHPKIIHGGERLPTPSDESRLHHLAHEQCIIANSIKAKVTVSAGGKQP